MMPKITGTLDPGALNILAENVINENARESEVWILSEGSVPEIRPRYKIIRTYHK